MKLLCTCIEISGQGRPDQNLIDLALEVPWLELGVHHIPGWTSHCVWWKRMAACRVDTLLSPRTVSQKEKISIISTHLIQIWIFTFDHSKRHLKQNSWRQLLVKHLFSCWPRHIEQVRSGDERPSDAAGEACFFATAKLSFLPLFTPEDFFFRLPWALELEAIMIE